MVQFLKNMKAVVVNQHEAMVRKPTVDLSTPISSLKCWGWAAAGCMVQAKAQRTVRQAPTQAKADW